jgi:hypothetical protein
MQQPRNCGARTRGTFDKVGRIGRRGSGGPASAGFRRICELSTLDRSRHTRRFVSVRSSLIVSRVARAPQRRFQTGRGPTVRVATGNSQRPRDRGWRRLDVNRYASVFDATSRRRVCVRTVSHTARNPWGNTVSYGDTLKQIVVAGSR